MTRKAKFEVGDEVAFFVDDSIELVYGRVDTVIYKEPFITGWIPPCHEYHISPHHTDTMYRYIQESYMQLHNSDAFIKRIDELYTI